MKAKEKKTKTKAIKRQVRKPKKAKATLSRKPKRKSVVSRVKPKLKMRPKAHPELKSQAESVIAPEIKKPKERIQEREVIQPIIAPEELKPKVVELEFPVTVKELAVKLQTKPSILIKELMGRGMMVGINQTLEEKAARDICKNLGFEVKKAPDLEEITLRLHQEEDPPHLLQARPPVVTLMGHVDHGKTSLLDKIRKSRVVESEHGEITQHIGAYQVSINLKQTEAERKITFLDTPGHEAFTRMRSRGASITDIVVLVVAADDGVMPQTVEAIDHAREAEVPIIVAINKIDKPQANIERVKKQLSQRELVAEDWEGKTITVSVSAKTGEGIDGLLEMILLEAEMLELKANFNRLASGVVIEAKLTKGRGPVSTLLVQNGTLHRNDNLIISKFYGKVKAMFDDYGRPVKEAMPSMPVEVLGISGVPEAGEQFYVVEDEKKAREVSYLREEKERGSRIRSVKRITLEQLYSQIKEGQVKELKIILKADASGSLEAIKESLKNLEIEEVTLNFIHEGIGDINTSDVILAAASNALVLGFNVVADGQAKELVSKEEVEVRIYNVIYELNNDIKAALEGMLEPKLKKIFLGRAEVRKVFKLSHSGVVAGCFITKGKILRSAEVDLLRNGKIQFSGRISSLKRFKDDVKEVGEGFECGISLGEFQDIQEGDIIEAYEIQKIARKL